MSESHTACVCLGGSYEITGIESRAIVVRAEKLDELDVDRRLLQRQMHGSESQLYDRNQPRE